MFAIGDKEWPGLSKLLEESGEITDLLPELILQKQIGRVQQVGGKLMGARGKVNHWDGSNLAVRMEEELGDLLAAIEFFLAHNPQLDGIAVTARALSKIELFRKWHNEETKCDS